MLAALFFSLEGSLLVGGDNVAGVMNCLALANWRWQCLRGSALFVWGIITEAVADSSAVGWSHCIVVGCGGLVCTGILALERGCSFGGVTVVYVYKCKYLPYLWFKLVQLTDIASMFVFFLSFDTPPTIYIYIGVVEGIRMLQYRK